MKTYKSINVLINSNKKSTHLCLSCNSKLSLYEYNKSSDICTSCQDKRYDKKVAAYIDQEGNNDIDTILNYKNRKR